MVRNVLLGLIRSRVEGKLKGLVEVSNDSLRINPWSKIPVDLHTRVSKFTVEDGKIVVVFQEDNERKMYPKADEHATITKTEPGPKQIVLAPGPSL